LTGFTLGKDYEWKQRVEKTIKRCLVGCRKTYYAEVYAGFNYGFGLRFPIKVSGTYTYHQDGANPQNEKAQLTTNFVPVNADAAQYQAAGLAPAKVFDGKEFVAQFGGHAGAGYDLPFIPNESVDVGIEFDFTKELEGDFKDGQFTPPTPGSGTGPSMDKFFTDIDLIGGAANFGVLGAKVFPAARVTLVSDSLTFTVHDYETGNDTVLGKSGQTIDLGVRPQNHSSHFAIGDPKYSLSLQVTPGIDARLFIDIAVWSHNWDFPVWFPEMAIKIPPDGATFGCHEGTVCSRSYEYTPSGHKDLGANEAGLTTGLAKWGDAFDANWLSECADETCRLGIKFIRQGYIFGALHKLDANDKLTMDSPEIVNFLKGADGEAKTLVNEAQARQTTNAAKSFGTFWTVWWSKQCLDSICLKKVKGIAFLAQLEAVSMQKQHEDMSTNEIIGTVGKKFAPSFEFEVKASKDRVAAEEAAQKARQTKRGLPKGLRVRPGT
jgi:hypothetical protein